MQTSQNNITLLSEDRLYKSLLEDDSSPVGHSERNLHLQLEIELENGEKVYISPQPTDEPLRLATEFCQKHNLDSDMIDILTESIQTSMIRSQTSYKKDQQEPLTIDNGSQSKKASHRQQICKSCEYKTGSASSHHYSKKSSLNFGPTLYEKSIIQEQAHHNWISRQKQRKAHEQLRQCTHTPEINSLSRCIVNNLRGLGEGERGSQSMIKLRDTEIKASFCLNTMLNSCASNNDGNKMTQSKQSQKDKSLIKSSSNIFDRLYKNKKTEPTKPISKKEERRPMINQISKQIVGNTKFNDRMARYHYQKQLKMAKCTQIEKEKENMHTPKIGLPPPNRNIEALPIGDYLYNRRKTITSQEAPLPKARLVNETSDRIYDYRKEEAFCRLFRHLDTEQRGKVSWVHLINNNLDEQIKSIVRPLLQEMQMMKAELNEDEFKKAINLLFGTLDPASRYILLNFKAKKTQVAPETNSFQPELNSRSQKIVRSMNRCRMSIYDYCSIKQAAKAQTLECERVAKQKSSLQECTFQPNIEKAVFYF